jgi:hypothetical protein
MNATCTDVQTLRRKACVLEMVRTLQVAVELFEHGDLESDRQLRQAHDGLLWMVGRLQRNEELANEM